MSNILRICFTAGNTNTSCILTWVLNVSYNFCQYDLCIKAQGHISIKSDFLALNANSSYFLMEDIRI